MVEHHRADDEHHSDDTDDFEHFVVPWLPSAIYRIRWAQLNATGEPFVKSFAGDVTKSARSSPPFARLRKSEELLARQGGGIASQTPGRHGATNGNFAHSSECAVPDQDAMLEVPTQASARGRLLGGLRGVVRRTRCCRSGAWRRAWLPPVRLIADRTDPAAATLPVGER